MALPLRVPAEQAGLRRHNLEEARIPRHALAVLEGLRFDGAGTERLRSLDDAGVRKVFEFCDRAQLTLTLDYVCHDALPGTAQARIGKNLRDYSKRFERLQAALFEIAETFEDRGIEFVVLKGITHSPEFTPDAVLRTQGDIDLWCGPESVQAAKAALVDLGYRSYGNSEGRHLPPMIRDRNWRWRGDHFASDLPIAVELHYRLWDEETEAIQAPGEADFWDRRATARVDGRWLPVLALEDTLAFAALHLLMHLLHGDVRLQRAWEIANFLESRAGDETFWSSWREYHAAPLRRLEAIIFQLVSDWFGCTLSPEVGEEIEQLPDDVKQWIEHYALSPVEALFHPNKDEIWLHLCLVERLREKCAIVARRVVPVGAAGWGGDSVTPDHVKQRLAFLGRRTVHHAQALGPVVVSGARWWWVRAQLGGGFWRYQAASTVFCLGMSVFFLLYNLYLLGLGYHENVLGRVSSLMSLGTLTGALPAAAITRRAGLRKTLILAILGSAAAAFLRVLNTGEPWLLACGFLNGLFLSLWAVSYSPAIAGLSGPRNRQSAFSIAAAAGMSIGILGGAVGGRLPGVLEHVVPGGVTGAQKATLLIAAALASLAAIPAARLRFAETAREGTKTYPRSRFMTGFLVALCCWSVAMGAFNPFFNAFFSRRMHMGTARIGLIYSCAQALQVLAVLCAPIVLRRLGEVRGIAAMQLVTALALALLALSPGVGMAAFAYAGFLSFQYMSEPGMFKMLTSRVAASERSGASALYFLVTSIAASLAAFAGGAAISRFGYPATLLAAASIAAVAAVLFRTLVQCGPSSGE